MGLTEDQIAALKAEIANDPTKQGYAGKKWPDVLVLLRRSSAFVTFPSRIEVLFGDPGAVGPREIDAAFPDLAVQTKSDVVLADAKAQPADAQAAPEDAKP